MNHGNLVHEKEELLFQLGLLFRPLLEIVADPAAYDVQQRTQAVGRYCAEWPPLSAQMRAFCNADPRFKYSVPWAQFHTALDAVERQLTYTPGATLEEEVPRRLREARAALASVPVTLSDIVPAGSPFSAHRVLRALCTGDVTTELAWIDPFYAADVFHRYLGDVPDTACVVLAAGEPTADKRDQARWHAFLDASRLYAAERGPDRYRLVVHPPKALHGRWLRVDGRRLYSVDNSSRDAAAKQDFAVVPADPTTHGPRVQTWLDSGRELFGPATLAHG